MKKEQIFIQTGLKPAVQNEPRGQSFPGPWPAFLAQKQGGFMGKAEEITGQLAGNSVFRCMIDAKTFSIRKNTYIFSADKTALRPVMSQIFGGGVADVFNRITGGIFFHQVDFQVSVCRKEDSRSDPSGPA